MRKNGLEFWLVLLFFVIAIPLAYYEIQGYVSLAAVNSLSVPLLEQTRISPASAQKSSFTSELTNSPNQVVAPLSFVLMDGEPGEYGVEVILNKDTEFEEHEIAYHIPAGRYIVKNQNDKSAGQISVYSSGPTKNGEWEEFVADENCARPIVVMAGETKELEIKNGQFIVLSDGTGNLQFTLK